jgi:hypothetical protein
MENFSGRKNKYEKSYTIAKIELAMKKSSHEQNSRPG